MGPRLGPRARSTCYNARSARCPSSLPRPPKRRLHRLLPARAARRPLLLANGGLKGALDVVAARRDVGDRAPDPGAQAGSDGSAKRGRLHVARPLDSDAAQVRLVLQQLVGERDAAVDAQAGERRSGVGGHADSHLLGLVGDALEHRPRDVPLVVREGQPDQRRARVVAPVRCEQPAKGGHKHEPLRPLRHLRGQRRDLRRGADHAKRVLEPVDPDRARSHRPLERVLRGRTRAESVERRREKPVARRHRCAAAVDEHEGAGAVSDLGLADTKAALADHGGLLVPNHPRERRPMQRPAVDAPNLLGARDDGWEGALRRAHAQRAHEAAVPAARP
mmetsp:Transcript_41742/g.131849  ORF Transcript_41742/g.131849 Transcript_41742/m.131849 type:complete len:334 (-) Transcript_41742:112-1113(-)